MNAINQISHYIEAIEDDLKISRKMIRAVFFCERAINHFKFISKAVPELEIFEYKKNIENPANNIISMSVTKKERYSIERIRKKD